MGRSVQRPLKIAIGVHGRFHAFDVAKALHQLGQEVTLFTNYPTLATHRFGLEAIQLRSFALHGAVTRGVSRLGQGNLLKQVESTLHQWFGKWLAQAITSQSYDVIDLYSGIAEETLQHRHKEHSHIPCLLERGSAHIRTQSRLLNEEEIRTGAPQNKPSSWMIAREEREYAGADHINLLSSFAYRTFAEEGVSTDRLSVTPLGVNVAHFRAPLKVIEQRCQRILSGAPLQILYVGQISYRKGFHDIREVARILSNKSFCFTLVGSPATEIQSRSDASLSHLRMVGHQPQEQLSEWYRQADLFLFPTVEDGFGMVLAQAQAAGLPIITTTNCSGPDFIAEGKSGWIVPIRAPRQIVEQLEWCDTHRAGLAEMVEYTYQNAVVRDWLDVGRDYLTLMQRLVAER